jgi:hypothetical protein
VTTGQHGAAFIFLVAATAAGCVTDPSEAGPKASPIGTAACPGGFDLADESDPNGYSLVTLGPVAAETDGELWGQDIFRSGPVRLCVPEDVVSMVVVLDGPSMFTDFESPGDGVLLSAESEAEYRRSSVSPFVAEGWATLQYPTVPTQRVEAVTTTSASPHRDAMLLP